MALKFPDSPTTGQTFTSGGVTYMWNGYGWVGGGVAQQPTEQFFDLSGLAYLDIPVPTWAKHCILNGNAFVVAGSYVLMRVSTDGTTFLAAMSTCSVRFSDVADIQPSVAWNSCWK